MKHLSFLTRKVTSRWTIFLLEQLLSLSSLFCSYFIGSLLSKDLFIRKDFLVLAMINLGISSIGMLIFRTHSGIIRYSEMKDVSTILKFTLFHTIIWITVLLVAWPGLIAADLALAILVINFGLLSLFMIGFRLLVKEVYGMGLKRGKTKDLILIYGAGSRGRATRKALAFDSKKERTVFAFIDDDPAKVGKHISGIDIISGSESSIRSMIEKHGINQLIIATSLSREKISILTSLCAEKAVRISTLPPLQEWVNGEVNLSKLDNLRIESLLGRDEIHLLNENAVKDFSGATIMVTGAAGSIGSEICRQLCRYPLQKLVLLDQSETGLHDIMLEMKEHHESVDIAMELASIRDEHRINMVMQRHKPEFVFHAAAYKHVPILEKFPNEVVLTNIKGTRILADAALKHEVRKFVMISTDKAVNPTNIMGASKRVAEMYVQSRHEENSTQFITTRFGNVLGSNGSVVPLFKKQIEKGGPVTVTHADITRYFMTIPEASSLVLEAAVMGQGGEIFVFDMGEPVKIVDLAKKMIELSGKRPGKDIDIAFTGLRPGEKMYEELFADKENLLSTHHPKIMKARTRAPHPDLELLLSELVDRAEAQGGGLMKFLQEIVPEFHPEITLPNVHFIRSHKKEELPQSFNEIDKLAQ